ncbi:PT domain-containing protein [Eubacterium xylanophilum]|uniref:PT domain-containing protein n=1 Tax=Eubacterium xylanophilum TaxID=39497 RepID=UPI00047A876A|nr:PT domain-containing protein [Eubacterium xylanophilum]
MLQRSKKFIAMAVVSAVAVSAMSGGQADAAKKLKLSTKKVEVKVGKTAKVSLKNGTKSGKVAVKVSSKKVVSVTKKFKGTKGYLKVKGKKAGKATIKLTCKVKGKKTKLTLKVTVKDVVKSSDNNKETSKATAAPAATAVSTVAATEVATKAPTEAPTVAPTDAPTVAPTPEPLPTNYPFQTFVSPNKLSDEVVGVPEIMTFLDGSPVTFEKWNYRAEEIRQMYQYYMYGMWRDGKGETVTYDNSGNNININVKTDGSVKGQVSDGDISFSASVKVPNGEAPEGGWPFFVCISSLQDEQNALDNGFAIVNFSCGELGSDNAKHEGKFYDLYPYNKEDWEEQSGALISWAWGASKIVDVIEQGAGEQYKLNKNFPMVAGVSRYGKATAVAGAFDKRFKITIPACSGAGGMGSFLYNPGGDVTQTYDVSSLGFEDTATFSKGGCEKIGALHVGDESGWFNENFKRIRIENTVFDQYMLASLFAQEGRTLMLVTGFNWDIWQNAPGLWYVFQKAKPTFDMLGLSDNLIIFLHDTSMSHAVVPADVDVLAKYYKEKYLGQDVPDFKISDLHTTLFDYETTPSGINNKAIYEAQIPYRTGEY